MSPSKVSTIVWDKFYNIVNGEKRESKGAPHHGVNPVTGEELWDCPVADKQDFDDAVVAANKAFVSWSQTPIEKRKELVNKFVDLYTQHHQDFLELLIKETGKPKQFANIEVQGTNAWIQHHTSLELPELRVEDDEKVVTTTYTPLGVVGAICPWNFPLVLSAGKFAPALVTGNTVIVKPSPFTPYTSLKLVELAQEIFPPGVFQAVGGNNELGAWLSLDPNIHKISFTGSIATGKKVAEAAAKTLKRVTLELGGNDASIVLPDVDIEKTAPELVMGAMQNSGQVCVATKRIYIHQDIYEPMVKAMSAVAQSIKVGGEGDDVLLGPVQNKMQYDRVKGFFEDSKKNGYKFAAGEPDVAASKGFFIRPTIIDNPPNDSRIIAEEPFGPIVPTQPWTDEEEVIARANNTNTGLGACVWGKDVARAERIAKRLQAGSVFVNSFEKPTPQAIFGGHKESGIGAEWGQSGLLSFCNPQSVHVYKQK